MVNFNSREKKSTHNSNDDTSLHFLQLYGRKKQLKKQANIDSAYDVTTNQQNLQIDIKYAKVLFQYPRTCLVLTDIGAFSMFKFCAMCIPVPDRSAASPVGCPRPEPTFRPARNPEGICL